MYDNDERTDSGFRFMSYNYTTSGLWYGIIEGGCLWGVGFFVVSGCRGRGLAEFLIVRISIGS